MADLDSQGGIVNPPRESEYYAPEIETMPREKLEKLQLERLKWQVHRCYHGSEFYREKFSKVGLKPNDIRSLDDLTKIPPVTKQELREEQAKYPPSGDMLWPPGKIGERPIPQPEQLVCR